MIAMGEAAEVIMHDGLDNRSLIPSGEARLSQVERFRTFGAPRFVRVYLEMVYDRS
jgi:hypothetical protein